MKAREYNWIQVKKYRKGLKNNLNLFIINREPDKEIAELILSGMSLYEALMEVNNRLIQKENGK